MRWDATSATREGGMLIAPGRWVAAKDIGRRLKCKKCNAGLTVTDAGLVLDDGSGSAPVPSVAEVADADEPGTKKNKGNRFARLSGTGGMIAAFSKDATGSYELGFGGFLIGVLVVALLPFAMRIPRQV